MFIHFGIHLWAKLDNLVGQIWAVDLWLIITWIFIKKT